MDWSSGIAVIEIMVDIAMIVAVQIEKKKIGAKKVLRRKENRRCRSGTVGQLKDNNGSAVKNLPAVQKP